MQISPNIIEIGIYLKIKQPKKKLWENYYQNMFELEKYINQIIYMKLHKA